MDQFKKHLINTDILTNFDIEDICEVLRIPLIGIPMKDEVHKLKNGCYIMNLDDSKNEGTHWTAFIITDNYVLYCDSFGMVPPESVYKLFLKTKKNIFVNQRQLQDMNSILCGWFAIYFLYCMIYLKGKTMLDKYETFILQWKKKSLKGNDKVKRIILSLL